MNKKNIILFSILSGIFIGNAEIMAHDDGHISDAFYNRATEEWEDPNFIGRNGETPLTKALKEGDADRAYMIISLNDKVSLNFRNEYDESPLDIAIYHDNIQFNRRGLVALIISRMRDLGQLDDAIRSAVLRRSKENGDNSFNLSIESKIALFALLKYKNNELRELPDDVLFEVAVFLSKFSCNVDIINEMSKGSIDRKFDILQYRISKQVKYWRAFINNNNPRYSVFFDYDMNAKTKKEDIRMFIEDVPNINQRDMIGQTLMHHACCVRDACGHALYGLELLLKNGADMNLQDYQGNTPLHLACMIGAYNHVRLLLQNGAYTNLKNNDGQTPLMLAQMNDHQKIVDLLSSAN